MERLILRLEGIEHTLLKDPTLRTLAGSSATLPFVGLRIQEIIKSVVNARREQEIDILRDRLDAYERGEVTDSAVLKQMIAESQAEVGRLQRIVIAKQDQLDIITKSHRQQQDQTSQRKAECDQIGKQHSQLQREHHSVSEKYSQLDKNYRLLQETRSQLEAEIRSLTDRTHELSSKLKQQTDRAESLHSATLQQQSNLSQTKSQCQSYERQLRDSSKKVAEASDALEHTTTKLRKAEFDLRSETEKLYLSRQKEQDLAKELDQLKESARTKERQLREMTNSHEQEILKVRQAVVRADSLERDKALLEAQLSIEKQKQKNYLSQLEKKAELERSNLQLREELMVAAGKDKTSRNEIERLTDLHQSSRAKLTEELAQKQSEIVSLSKAKSDLELIIRDQSLELNDRHVQLGELAEGARRSQHRFLADIQGMKHGVSKQIAKRDRKLQSLNSEIRVMEGKLVQLTKRLGDSEQRENSLIRQKAVLLKSLRDSEIASAQTRGNARRKLTKLMSAIEELRSEVRHTRKEHAICLKEISSALTQHTDVLASLLKQHTRRKEADVEQLSKVFKSEIEELQRLLNKRTNQLRKEAEIYRDEIVHRDELIQKTTGELKSERKSNLALRQTLNSESKLNIIRKLQFQHELSATKQKQRQEELSTVERLDDLSRRYNEFARDSRDKHDRFQRKLEDFSRPPLSRPVIPSDYRVLGSGSKLDQVTARKSVSFRQ